MTAEIAVLNRVGVALAADSAVTIGPRADKIWTSADKLFQLSEADPVGVMIYGNADFVGIPWETVIKAYRREHGSNSLETVREHAERFFSYLSRNETLFPADRQDAHAHRLMHVFWLGIRERIRRALDSAAETRDGLAPEDLANVVDATILEILKAVRAAKPVPGASLEFRVQLRHKLAPALEKKREELFGALPMSRAAKRALVSVAIVMLTKAFFASARAGIVLRDSVGVNIYRPWRPLRWSRWSTICRGGSARGASSSATIQWLRSFHSRSRRWSIRS